MSHVEENDGKLREKQNKSRSEVTYTIGLLEDGTWVITELDVGDGRAC